MLSKRLRPGIEAAPWVIKEVEVLERELNSAYLELRKIRPSVKAVFDREVWRKAMLTASQQERGENDDAQRNG